MLGFSLCMHFCNKKTCITSSVHLTTAFYSMHGQGHSLEVIDFISSCQDVTHTGIKQLGVITLIFMPAILAMPKEYITAILDAI